jgi:hypothetical protein
VVYQAATITDAPLSVSVPAGSYLVLAYAALGNTDEDVQEAICSIQGTIVSRNEIEGDGGGEMFPIMGTVVLGAPGSITVDCGGFGISEFSKRMFVIKVGSIS